MIRPLFPLVRFLLAPFRLTNIQFDICLNICLSRAIFCKRRDRPPPRDRLQVQAYCMRFAFSVFQVLKDTVIASVLWLLSIGYHNIAETYQRVISFPMNHTMNHRHYECYSWQGILKSSKHLK